MELTFTTPRGLELGNSTADRIGFHGVAPVAQRSGSSGAAVTKTAGAALTGTLTGTVDGAMEDVAAVSTAGGNTYADSAINTAITAVNLQLKELQTRLNQLVVDNAANITLINELRATIVAKGMHAGA